MSLPPTVRAATLELQVLIAGRVRDGLTDGAPVGPLTVALLDRDTGASYPLRGRVFDDGSFDRVISTFGHMFAPDHARAAAEMKRAVRPDGRTGICCWTPGGAIGKMFHAIAALVPSPDDAPSPLLWGTEEHVRELLGEAEFERREVEWRDASVESYADFMLESFGPLLNAQEVLGERKGELRTAFIGFLNEVNMATDGTVRFRGEYLISVVKP